MLVYYGLLERADAGPGSPHFIIDGQRQVLLDSTDTWSGVHSRSTATSNAEAVDGHSYVRFEGLTGSGFTLTLDPESAREGISGIQIVANNQAATRRISIRVGDGSGGYPEYDVEMNGGAVETTGDEGPAIFESLYPGEDYDFRFMPGSGALPSANG